MGVLYFCRDRRRLQELEKPGRPNGIDSLEVIDQEAELDAVRQRTLLVRFVRPDGLAALGPANVRIEGGVRVQDVGVVWVHILDAVLAPGFGEIPAEEKAFFDARYGAAAPEPEPEPDRVLVVRTDRRGDFSAYRLRLVASTLGPEPLRGYDPPDGFDRRLSEVELHFKVECASDFDCVEDEECPEEAMPEPALDYLAKDYASFRRLMLDRLAAVTPAWQERNPADLGVAVVEALAYAADHVSYFGDAAATEAYLGTARRRVSVRRHARLLDYPVDDGASARVWAALRFEPDQPGDDGAVLPGPSADGTRPGTALLTSHGRSGAVVDVGPDGEPDAVQEALRAGALVFETLEDVELRQAHNEIRFHTWGDESCCLPRGATRATLADPGGSLAATLRQGDVLLLEEVRSAVTGRRADADRDHRHAVRLVRLEATTDPLFPDDQADESDPPAVPLRVLEVEWAAEDALPFPLCLHWVEDKDEPGGLHPVAVARGNAVLADHGRTLPGEVLRPLPERPVYCPGEPPGGSLPDPAYRPPLAFGPLSRQAHVRHRTGSPVLVDRERSAAAAFRRETAHVRPAIRLVEPDGELWEPRSDLLASDRFAREFVVESEDDGTAALRFGDGIDGRAPVDGLRAVYRVGMGAAGNVGPGALRHVVLDPARIADADLQRKLAAGIRGVTNPLPARGGGDGETLTTVRLAAPQAFRRQERAVTTEDWAAAAERHPEVQKAAARFRWFGSWYTVAITVDRLGALPVDREFEDDLMGFLERFRVAGQDLEIQPPRFVPLDLGLTVCVRPGFFRSDVREAVLEVLGNRDLPGGGRGLFHPDELTFGQPVFLSRIVAAVMEVPGVAWVDTDGSGGKPNRFQRWGRPDRGEFAAGRIDLEPLEIARLDNDPSEPEHGRVELFMEGGR
ncbi:MAG TPA: putative baseplate assembly protein [Thermoanaerobaculia bacterium]|nr:putative baseplate assembly protein [Thermoanaerobaculia bacterium]